MLKTGSAAGNSEMIFPDFFIKKTSLVSDALIIREVH